MGTQVTLSISTVDSSMQGQYVITWNDTPIVNQGEPIVLSRGYLSGNGAFSAHVTVPESPGGSYFITLQPSNGAGRTNFQFSLQPDFSASPYSVKPGETVELKGTGFPANQRVFIYLNDIMMDINVSASARGSFYQSVKIPAVGSGEHKITAANEIYGIRKSIAVQVIPLKTEVPEPPKTPVPPPAIPVVPQDLRDTDTPSAPVPQNPMGNKIGYFGDQMVTFKWSEVTDSSHVKYELEVSTETQSIEPALKVNDLQANYYSTLVKPGTYYWKVRSVDAAGNKSEWRYAPYTFQVAEVSILLGEFVDFMDQTRVFVIILWAIGIYVLASIVINVIRRMKKSRD